MITSQNQAPAATATALNPPAGVGFYIEWVFRTLIGILAFAVAYCAFARSIEWPRFLSLDWVPAQSARDLAVILVTYAALSLVRQEKEKKRGWYFDVAALMLTFGVWLASVFADIGLQDKAVVSTVAVLVAVGARLFRPVWTKERWIWQR